MVPSYKAKINVNLYSQCNKYLYMNLKIFRKVMIKIQNNNNSRDQYTVPNLLYHSTSYLLSLPVPPTHTHQQPRINWKYLYH